MRETGADSGRKERNSGDDEREAEAQHKWCPENSLLEQRRLLRAMYMSVGQRADQGTPLLMVV